MAAGDLGNIEESTFSRTCAGHIMNAGSRLASTRKPAVCGPPLLCYNHAMSDYDGIAFPREPRLDVRDARRLLADGKAEVRKRKRECRRAVRRAVKSQLSGGRGTQLSSLHGWIA